MFQATWAVRWVAGLLPACSMGVPAQPGLPGLRDLAQRNEASIRLDAIPNTVQGSQTTHHPYTQTL